jgi:hypothetical protein
VIRFNRDAKFDMQLSAALIAERRLGDIFKTGKIELKTETYQWRRTGNIAIEYRQKGQPSGIAVTEAEYWIHQLCDDDGSTLVYLMFPIDRLKPLARERYRAGHHRRGGDGGGFEMVLLSLRDLLGLTR